LVPSDLSGDLLKSNDNADFFFKGKPGELAAA
jgi:hypothetical protein